MMHVNHSMITVFNNNTCGYPNVLKLLKKIKRYYKQVTHFLEIKSFFPTKTISSIKNNYTF